MSRLTALVPLDGSKQAEAAFSYLPCLSPLGEVWVRLIGVCDPEWSSKRPEMRERIRGLTEGYLGDAAERLRQASGLAVETACREGDAAAEVLREAGLPDVDLIAMTTRAKTGLEKWRLGSVADRVIRGAPVPTLVIGPEAAPRSGPLAIQRIVAPLDGSKLAEEALPVAGALAEGLDATLHLVRAVRPPAWPDLPELGGVAADVLESEELTASLYLQEARLELGLRTPVEVHAIFGPPADVVMRVAEEQKADLLVMTSHGRTGFVRWALGSVADRVVRGSTPVLIIRPGAGVESAA